MAKLRKNLRPLMFFAPVAALSLWGAIAIVGVLAIIAIRFDHEPSVARAAESAGLATCLATMIWLVAHLGDLPSWMRSTPAAFLALCVFAALFYLFVGRLAHALAD